MKIVKSYVTKSDCYNCDKYIKPKGIMLHSVGCPQPRAQVFIGQWNRSGWDVCANAIIDGITGDVYQTLPWTMRSWHCGDSGNDTHISVEMCEPDTITYKSGATWTEDSDGKNTLAVVKRTYKSAVQLFAKLCKDYNLDPLKDGVILSHSEGYKRGIASGHADVEHIWSKVGLSMNQFRKDVKAAMGSASSVTESTSNKTSTSTSSSAMYKVQIGAFKSKANADAQLKKVKAKKIDATVVKSGSYYKVQAGAFSSKANADAQLKKVKAAGFDAVIVSTAKTSSSTSTATIKVGSTVKVKKGAKTYDGHTLASFVYDRKHKVSEISGDRVVITYNGEVVAAVKKSNLTLA